MLNEKYIFINKNYKNQKLVQNTKSNKVRKCGYETELVKLIVNLKKIDFQKQKSNIRATPTI